VSWHLRLSEPAELQVAEAFILIAAGFSLVEAAFSHVMAACSLMTTRRVIIAPRLGKLVQAAEEVAV